MPRTPATKVNSTKNYRLFGRNTNNRPIDMRKHRKLEQSMERYGFLKCFPIVCCRNGSKHLVVKDGQHRLAIAEKLQLPVHWMEEDVDFDVAAINSTPKTWTLRDYAQTHAANGIAVYQEGLDFAEQHKLPVGTAFALLAGTMSFGNTQEAFIGGTFRVKDRKWADAVAGIYAPIVALSPRLKNARFTEACMAVCRAAEFDAGRLLQNAERCRDKLVPYSTKDAYLDMLETVYNFGRKSLVGLKAAAMMAMRERNAAVAARNKKAAKKNRQK